jgi:penicillin-binding protein 1A
MKRRRRRKRLPGWLLALTVVGCAIGIGALGVVGYVLAVAAGTPDIGEVEPTKVGETSSVYAADGSRLGFVQSDIIRTPVKPKKIPDVMREAVIAIEDERFYEHNGIDLGAIGRAAIENISSGETVQGGSTITQQLARALYIDDPEDTYARKIEEARLAQQIEEDHSKEWILARYLNSVPFGTVNGSTALGVEAASEVYFSKDAEGLELHEAALLAGLPQAPSEYNPFRESDAARARRDEVLDRMAEQGFIRPGQAEQAKEQDLDLDPSDLYSERREPYVFDYVQDQLIDRYGVETLRKGGLEIHTTIDPELQEAGRAAIASNVYGPSGALVSVDPSNGDITAMASSGEYDDRNFNLAAQGHRQPGSAFKTMVLTAAVREGIDPDSTTYVSQPLDLDTEYGPWEVSTYDESYSGSMTVTEGTLKSDNTVYAQLILDVGPEDVAETAKLLGIETKLDGLPAEGLGGLTIGVSPLEMASAYATLASGGIRHEPQAIESVEFPNGDVEKFGDSKGKRVLTDGEAYEVTRILQENISSGTGTGADIGCSSGQAGKTGTTDDFKDAWFVGYTPALSTSVWVGYPDAAQPTGIAGGQAPASIWNSFMSVANPSCESFPEPSTPVELTGHVSDYAASGTEAPTTDSTETAPAPAPEEPVTPEPAAPTGEYDPELYESPPITTPEPSG